MAYNGKQMHLILVLVLVLHCTTWTTTLIVSKLLYDDSLCTTGEQKIHSGESDLVFIGLDLLKGPGNCETLGDIV